MAGRRGSQGVANYTVIGTPENVHSEIARVYHGNRFADGEANTSLIVAAPSLLKAVKLALMEFERMSYQKKADAEVIEVLRATVAIAEGKI